ncbi:hypothetical protein [Niabella beijingensis]|uniref:hypothetical protein n=1 Tax=Niabella beijingensis TaxID=2872700 RepID=UPI001CBE0250|nr:hypothetical protein [Niabella beijingensis]MBZ4189489.1 hypothetical protein [Niabella beijingensis]
MQKTPYTDSYLSALVLKYQQHPKATDIHTVLYDLFHLSPPQEQGLYLEQFCTAALTNAYAWKQGAPANAIDYGHQLELLTEVAWLLYKKGKYNKKEQRATREAIELPMPLTTAEYLQPQLYLQQFFAYTPLHQWKQYIAAFTVNAVSNESVTDELPGAVVLAFASYMNKLIYAVYRMAVLKGVGLR